MTRKQIDAVISGAFIGFLVVVFLLFLILPDRQFSDNENRSLTQLPKPSWEQIRSGKAGQDFEKYINDQFPGRSRWISFKSHLELWQGKKDSNGVYFGADDYLLQVLEKPAPDQIQKNVAALQSFLAKHDNYQGSLFLIPTSTWVLDAKLPKYAPALDEWEIAQQVQEALGDSAIKYGNAFAALKSQSNEEIYYRTDHHYTTLGAYYTYVALGEVLGYEPLPLAKFQRQQMATDFYGTLYSKGVFDWLPPDTMEVFVNPQLAAELTVVDDGSELPGLYDYSKLATKDKYSLFLGGNYGFLKIKTNVTNGKSLNVVKDSFAHALIPFLANHYETINVFDLRYFRAGFEDYLPADVEQEFLFIYNIASYVREATIVQIKYF